MIDGWAHDRISAPLEPVWAPELDKQVRVVISRQIQYVVVNVALCRDPPSHPSRLLAHDMIAAPLELAWAPDRDCGKEKASTSTAAQGSWTLCKKTFRQPAKRADVSEPPEGRWHALAVDSTADDFLENIELCLNELTSSMEKPKIMKPVPPVLKKKRVPERKAGMEGDWRVLPTSSWDSIHSAFLAYGPKMNNHTEENIKSNIVVPEWHAQAGNNDLIVTEGRAQAGKRDTDCESHAGQSDVIVTTWQAQPGNTLTVDREVCASVEMFVRPPNNAKENAGASSKLDTVVCLNEGEQTVVDTDVLSTSEDFAAAQLVLGTPRLDTPPEPPCEDVPSTTAPLKPLSKATLKRVNSIKTCAGYLVEPCMGQLTAVISSAGTAKPNKAKAKAFQEKITSLMNALPDEPTDFSSDLCYQFQTLTSDINRFLEKYDALF